MQEKAVSEENDNRGWNIETNERGRGSQLLEIFRYCRVIIHQLLSSRFVVDLMSKETCPHEEAKPSVGSKVIHHLRSDKMLLDCETQSTIDVIPTRQEAGCISVSSVFSKNDKDSFIKRTEIKVGDRLFIINEKFELTAREPVAISSQNNHSQEIDFQEESANNKGESSSSAYSEVNSQMRDRKNVVKNIVKAFNCWIRKGREKGEVSEQIATSLGELLLRKRFNNQLIIDLVANEQIRGTFGRFLSE